MDQEGENIVNYFVLSLRSYLSPTTLEPLIRLKIWVQIHLKGEEH